MADKKPIKITETVLRDAHQSLIANRMTNEQMNLYSSGEKKSKKDRRDK